MMSRALLIALSMGLVAVSASRLGTVCEQNVCGNGGESCCFRGMMLNAGDRTCSNATYTCGLCGQDDLPSCSTCGSDYSPFEANGAENPSWCVAPFKASADGDLFGAATTFPIIKKRTDGSSTALATFNGMKGWEDLNDSTFQGFQEFLLGLTANIPHWTQRSGFDVSLRCDSQTIGAAEGCSLFIFVYRCPPCAAHTGNFEAQILAETDPVWSVNPCGSTFNIAGDGATHQFAVYSTEVKAPRTVTFSLDQDIAFTFWGFVGQEVVCKGLATEAACDAAPINCVWDDVAGECAPRGCLFNGGQAGPGLPRCSVCADDELQPDPSTPYNN